MASTSGDCGDSKRDGRTSDGPVSGSRRAVRLGGHRPGLGLIPHSVPALDGRADRPEWIDSSLSLPGSVKRGVWGATSLQTRARAFGGVRPETKPLVTGPSGPD
jgi:hypothetical protein